MIRLFCVSGKKKKVKIRWVRLPRPLARRSRFCVQGDSGCVVVLLGASCFHALLGDKGTFEASRAFWMSLFLVLIPMQHPPYSLGERCRRRQKFKVTQKLFKSSCKYHKKVEYCECVGKTGIWFCQVDWGKPQEEGRFKLRSEGWLRIVQPRETVIVTAETPSQQQRHRVVLGAYGLRPWTRRVDHLSKLVCFCGQDTEILCSLPVLFVKLG